MKEKARFSWNRAFSVLLLLGLLRSPARDKPAHHNKPARHRSSISAAFESEGYALAATDAQRCQAFLGVALDHFMQQGHQHAAA